MSDEKPPLPPQPTTKQIPKVEVPGNTLDAVLTEMRAMRAEQRASTQELSDKVDTLSVNVDALQHDAKDTRLRLGRMERELDEVKDRQQNNSVRAKVDTASEVNLQQDAAIANVIVRLGSVESNQQTAAKERADTAAMVKEVRDAVIGVATNKKVLFVGKVVFAAAVAYSGLHGLKVLP